MFSVYLGSKQEEESYLILGGFDQDLILGDINYHPVIL